MIVLMQGVALMLLFPEDRTLKTIKRVLTSPVSEKQYLFAQGIFTFLCLYIPTYLAVLITKVCFSMDVGFSLGMLVY
jgi:ABC-2 type transport system permease protein